MPVNKDAMARYRIIDRMLADPQQDYTTKDIEKAVARACPRVTMRMIQKDIKALEEEFGKELVRNAGGRGTVKYKDQSTPLFFQVRNTDEAIGAPGRKAAAMQDIYFAARKPAVKRLLAKRIHPSQEEVDPETEKELFQKYPSLKGWKLFAVTCRPDAELFSVFASYRDTVLIVEPAEVRETMRGQLLYTLKNYDELSR